MVHLTATGRVHNLHASSAIMPDVTRKLAYSERLNASVTSARLLFVASGAYVRFVEDSLSGSIRVGLMLLLS